MLYPSPFRPRRISLWLKKGAALPIELWAAMVIILLILSGLGNSSSFFYNKVIMKYWYWFMQNLMWPFGWALIRIFYRVEVFGKENISKVKPPVIIVSNHRGTLDGFLIASIMPWGSRIFPLRFMIETKRFTGSAIEFLRKIGLMSIFNALVGGFPSGRGSGVEKAIETPLKFLKRGSAILMFPEGRIQYQETLGVFRNGASALALKSKAAVLPFFIKFQNNRRVRIFIGEPFKLASYSIEAGTLTLKEKIEKLSRQR
jgi:1-acyl-sn-glycerol-3-phosphate acyltransferase